MNTLSICRPERSEGPAFPCRARSRPFAALRATNVLLAAAYLLGASPSARAQKLSKADSQLVAMVLLAEDRRDTTVAALHEAASNADPRIRELARRAIERTRDTTFKSRTTFPDPAPSRKYADPAWRLRYRALTAKRTDCAALRDALGDEAWGVRFRAADLVPGTCSGDAALASTLASWARTLPADGRHEAGKPTWHTAAHGLNALAKIAPADARAILPTHVASPIPWVRAWAARAATTLGDTATLKRLAHDTNDNVKEAGIDGLAKVAGHSADDDYLAALSAKGYQAVRAAARALAKSPRGDDVVKAALAAHRRLWRDSSETSRDARVAVMARIVEFANASNTTPAQISDLQGDFDCQVAKAAQPMFGSLAHLDSYEGCMRFDIGLRVPADAVPLAMGGEYRVRVTMADSSGGGSYVVRMRGDAAPIMAARVLNLVRSGYYNGLVWQRVEPDFVVQGGGPGANEYVGSRRFMRDELSRVSHVRGTIGMSTRGHDTGDGQWFFNLKDNVILDPLYTVFGEVVEGIEVVDQIMEGDVIKSMVVLPAPR